jgi:hypothetical protein
LTYVLDGEWSASRACCFTPGEITPSTHWIGGWVGPGAGQGVMKREKFYLFRGSNPGCPSRSRPLYRLRYSRDIIKLFRFLLPRYLMGNPANLYIALGCHGTTKFEKSCLTEISKVLRMFGRAEAASILPKVIWFSYDWSHMLRNVWPVYKN